MESGIELDDVVSGQEVTQSPTCESSDELKPHPIIHIFTVGLSLQQIPLCLYVSWLFARTLLPQRVQFHGNQSLQSQ